MVRTAEIRFLNPSHDDDIFDEVNIESTDAVSGTVVTGAVLLVVAGLPKPPGRAGITGWLSYFPEKMDAVKTAMPA